MIDPHLEKILNSLGIFDKTRIPKVNECEPNFRDFEIRGLSFSDCVRFKVHKNNLSLTEIIFNAMLEIEQRGIRVGKELGKKELQDSIKNILNIDHD